MELPIDVIDPGSVQVPTTNGEAFAPGLGIPVDVTAGEFIANQPTGSAINLRGDSFKPGLGIVVEVDNDLVAKQSTSAAPLLNVSGDKGGMSSFATLNITDPGTPQVPQANVESQVFGSAIGKGLTPDVYV